MKRFLRPSRCETAWIGLGSNIGDRVAWLAAAVRGLRRMPRTRLSGLSPVYLSRPVGFVRQRAFANAAARIETGLSPRELLGRLHEIERSLGRRRAFRHGPRNIDLDILMFGCAVLTDDFLTVPHPRLHERAFALAPCAALDPGIEHPVIGVKLLELLPAASGKSAKLPVREQSRFRRLARKA